MPTTLTIHGYFEPLPRRWVVERLDGTFERIHTVLRERVRRQAGRDPTPSAAIIDSQSVKTTQQGGPRGSDGGKKVNGRKRHLLVDTLGLLLKVVVPQANLQDRDGAQLVRADCRPSSRGCTICGLIRATREHSWSGSSASWAGASRSLNAHPAAASR